MLKKVSVSQLKIGMYIHDLNCLWFKHPFAFNQFVITEKKQLSELLKSGIKEVTIDTNKGLAKDRQAVNNAEQINKTINNNIIETKDEVKGNKPGSNESLSSEPVFEVIIPLAQELRQAKTIKHEAVKLVKQLMDDVRLGKQVKLEKLNPVITEIIASIFRNHDALLGLIRIRNVDEYTYEHSVSVAIILTFFARCLGFNAEELKQFCLGGLLVDLGKIRIPQTILIKTGKLTEKEYALIQNHVVYGLTLVKEMNIQSDIVDKIMLEHHERLDGSGYPNHKSGTDISLFGHMAAIVDTYDACITNHPYKKGKPPHSVLRKFISRNQHHFNQDIMNQFIHCIGIYPIGSMLALSNGHFAVVIESGKDGLLYPKVRIFFDSVKREFITPEDFEFTTEGSEYSISGVEDPVKWGITVENFMPHSKV